MRWTIVFGLSLLFVWVGTNGYAQQYRNAIEESLGADEYTRLMHLSLDGFDQSYEGFRKYSENYDLVRLIIPEYINLNHLSIYEAANLHWHLGQMHAFNDNIEAAIAEMAQSNLESSPIFWKCYVEGSIAFLKKDKAKLLESLEILRKQDNQMNIEFLEKFVKYFDRPYWEAYNAD
jgi:hypothetical protein